MTQKDTNNSSESLPANSADLEIAGKKIIRRLSPREDWVVIPYLLLMISGFIVALIDFVLFQRLHLEFIQGSFPLINSALFIIGFIIMIIGGYLRTMPGRTLVNAGITGVWGTSRLQITDKHQLVTDSYYKRIRHPIYLGEMIRNLGFPLIFSSFFGMICMILSAGFLLIRIEIEEKMLVEAFGEEYEEYRTTTKKVIPFLY